MHEIGEQGNKEMKQVRKKSLDVLGARFRKDLKIKQKNNTWHETKNVVEVKQIKGMVKND